jgi:hypothetical protein
MAVNLTHFAFAAYPPSLTPFVAAAAAAAAAAISSFVRQLLLSSKAAAAITPLGPIEPPPCSSSTRGRQAAKEGGQGDDVMTFRHIHTHLLLNKYSAILVY